MSGCGCKGPAQEFERRKYPSDEEKESVRKALARNIPSYTNYEETKSCYLDGRYVNVALRDVPEFNTNIIHINLQYDENASETDAQISGLYTALSKLREGWNIFRVVTRATFGVSKQDPMFLHSTLLWLNTSTGELVHQDVVEISEVDNIIISEVKQRANSLLKKEVTKIWYSNDSSDEYEFTLEILEVHHPEKINRDCRLSGFCNAYIIKTVLDWHENNNQMFDEHVNILRYASYIEHTYKNQLPTEEPPEIEYGGFGLLEGIPSSQRNRR